MATHSSILAQRTPWTEEPGGLLVLGAAQSQTRLKQFITHARDCQGFMLHLSMTALFKEENHSRCRNKS